MSRCRTSCVSSARVFMGKTIDLLAPWLTAMVPLAYGAVLLLAPSGHGALAYDELVVTRVVATPMMPNPAYWDQAGDPVADYVARVSWPGTAARK